jgi:hypothetical protein
MVAASFGAVEAIGETGKGSNWHVFPSWLPLQLELYTPLVFSSELNRWDQTELTDWAMTSQQIGCVTKNPHLTQSPTASFD